MASSSDPFYVEVQLAGDGVPAGAAFTLRVQPSWAPLGAMRFKVRLSSLVARHRGRILY
jgi:hypothetical protein